MIFHSFHRLWKTFLSTCGKEDCGTVENIISFNIFRHFTCGKVCGKFVENFFLLFSISFFHNLEYHNDDLYEQGSDKVEC